MQIASKPRVHLASRQELDGIGLLVSEAFASLRPVLAPHIFEPYVKDARDVAGRWAKASVAVLEAEGRLVGTVTYNADAAFDRMGWPPGLAGLRTLAVAPSAQGRGYGRALCEWCVMQARRQGSGGLALHTASFMPSACKLYESLGFERRPAHDLFASDIIGFDPALGDQQIIAYLLPLKQVESSHDR
ncbi:GNAT family N-acetyltransferase [Mesorhizobium sp. M0976]|uniref:GNAT family N-acetyltransferase n=1 Tax=unclassified Mesorhizobium TaxID=325217 RepID=UPI00333B31C8